jgi:N utilization substance protein B
MSNHTPKTTAELNESALIHTLSESLHEQAASQPHSKPSKAPSKSARTRAREFALQALYQLIIGKNEPEDIDVFTRDLVGFKKADSVHYDALLHGCAKERTSLDAAIVPVLDRPLSEISPIERAVMWLGVFELQHCLDVPWRVVLNEYVELAKQFGGTDGHKYVNAVLNELATTFRAIEIGSSQNTPHSLTSTQD